MWLEETGVPGVRLEGPGVKLGETEDPEVRLEGAEGPGVRLQKEVDERVAEAQRTGHLDLSNLGLPFFPSAVLLTDGSIIHVSNDTQR